MVRVEVRFASRRDLDQVKRAAKAAGARSVNAWLLEVILREFRSNKRIGRCVEGPGVAAPVPDPLQVEEQLNKPPRKP